MLKVKLRIVVDYAWRDPEIFHQAWKEFEEYFGRLKEKNNIKTNFTDFFTDLEKIGIPQKMIFQEMPFLNDLWNYFPHKLLRDKSPAELYKKAYGEKYGN